MKARLTLSLAFTAPRGCFDNVPGALQWLLSSKTDSLLEMAGLLWHLLMLSLESPKDMHHDLLKTRIIAAADVHLQYMRELEAEPSSITGASAELLTAVLAELPPLLCIATLDCAKRPGRLLSDAGLVLSPGVFNAAMMQLAGLIKYLHTLHIGKQSPGLKSSDQRSGGRASSSSSSSSPGTSSRRAAKVIGASSFAQLQLPADHEGVGVVGGGRAVAAVSKRLERKDSTVGNGDWDFMVCWQYAMIVDLLDIAVRHCQMKARNISTASSSVDIVTHAEGDMQHRQKAVGREEPSVTKDGVGTLGKGLNDLQDVRLEHRSRSSAGGSRSIGTNSGISSSSGGGYTGIGDTGTIDGIDSSSSNNFGVGNSIGSSSKSGSSSGEGGYVESCALAAGAAAATSNGGAAMSEVALAPLAAAADPGAAAVIQLGQCSWGIIQMQQT